MSEIRDQLQLFNDRARPTPGQGAWPICPECRRYCRGCSYTNSLSDDDTQIMRRRLTALIGGSKGASRQR